MAFNATALTALQAQLSPFPLSKLMQLVQAVDVVGGAVTNSSGTITIAGRALSNQQYAMIYEMITDMY
jgi:hypothetical protein